MHFTPTSASCRPGSSYATASVTPAAANAATLSRSALRSSRHLASRGGPPKSPVASIASVTASGVVTCSRTSVLSRQRWSVRGSARSPQVAIPQVARNPETPALHSLQISLTKSLSPYLSSSKKIVYCRFRGCCGCGACVTRASVPPPM